MFNEPEPRDPKGYSDNGHIEFECDFCGNELVDIWKVKESDFITKINCFVMIVMSLAFQKRFLEKYM